MIQDKVNLIVTSGVGVASIQATAVVTDTISNIDIAHLSQVIVNVLIGIITIYKLIKPTKKLHE